MKTKHPNPANKGGRPAKFGEPSRPVTMTLPDRILARLAEIDDDRAKAVVRAVEAALGGAGGSIPPVDELPVADDEALLVVSRSRLLEAIPWLTMIQISPGRHLISLRDNAPIEKLEVALEDILDGTAGDESERRVLRLLLARIRTPRRNRAVRTEQLLVVRTPPEPSRRAMRGASRL